MGEEYIFKPGDRVVFKTWDEMEKEYGLDENGYVICKFKFTDEMEDSIDRDIIYTIEDIKDDGRVYFSEEPSEYSYSYSTDMIRLATEEDRKEIQCPTFFDWEFNIPDEIRDILQVNHHVDAGKDKATSGYLALMTALFFGTGVSVRFDFGKHESVSPNDIFDYCNGVRGYFCMIETGGNKEEYDSWAADNSVSIFELCGFSVYAKDKVFIVLVNDKKDMYNDDFAFGLVQCIHDVLNLQINEELYSCILERDFEKAKNTILTTAEVIIKAKKRKEFDHNIENLSKSLSEVTVHRFENNLQRAKNNVENIEARLRRAYEELKQAQKNKIYYEVVNRKLQENDLIELLKSDFDNITNIDTSSPGYIYISIKQTLMFFNDDDWTSLRRNYMEDNPNIKYLLDAIFTRKAQVMFEQGVRININDAYVQKYDGWSCKVGIPNPHITGYDCWGDNKSSIDQALMDFNLDVAYNTIKSAIAGINLVDKPVLDKFCAYLRSRNYDKIPCITDIDTGKVMIIPEADTFYRLKEEGSES
jgi:hypothetical protein